MGKFGDRKKKASIGISTASLPDIVFMILFFFMISTSMKENELVVELSNSSLPQAIESKKLEKKSLISYIYVGKPRAQYQRLYGTEPRIQLNSSFADLSEIFDYIIAERQKREEKEVNYMTTSLKVHQDTKMGIVTDIKQELRKASALKLNYSTRKKI
jgi:biopolymer transport protein ExbD